MESGFEPAVQMEETPEARIVIVHLPGFRKENLKVQIENQGNLIISGERGGKEMEEMTKVQGERLEDSMHKIRKVIAVPENLNTDARITAKFRDQTLRVSLPLLVHMISDQVQNHDAIPGHQSAQSKDEKSSVTAGQDQDSMQERSDDQRARHLEAIRPDDDKAKVGAAAEESKGMVEDRKTEALKHGRDFVHRDPLLSKPAMERLPEDQSTRHPETIRPGRDHKAKPIAAAGESKELAKRGDQSVVESNVVRSRPASTGQEDSMKERSQLVAQDDQRTRLPEAIRQDDDRALKGSSAAAAEESKGPFMEDRKTEAPKVSQLEVEPPLSKDSSQAVSADQAVAGDQSQFIQSQSKQQDEVAAPANEGESDENSLPSPNDEFPEKLIQISSTTRRSLFFTRCCNVL